MKNFVITLLIAVAASTAGAQQLKVATGSAKGTYAAMFKEVNSVCATDVPMLETNTTGSIQNLDMLIGNQVNAVFTQTDVLYYRAQTEDLGNVKTLLTLHPEQVHIVVPTNSGIKTGGTMGIGAKPVVFQSIQQLAGYRIGAAGGSFVTAQVIRLQSEIPFQVVQYDDNTKLMAALKAGQVQAALLVGGQPLGAVAELGPDHRLVAIPEAVATKLKGVYRPSRLSYTKMNASGVATVATDALFVTREYKTPKMIATLAKFRTCAVEKIEEMKETTGTHPAWQKVDTANKGKWAYYDLPAK
jgi:hypothetical protein